MPRGPAGHPPRRSCRRPSRHTSRRRCASRASLAASSTRPWGRLSSPRGTTATSTSCAAVGPSTRCASPACRTGTPCTSTSPAAGCPSLPARCSTSAPPRRRMPPTPSPRCSPSRCPAGSRSTSAVTSPCRASCRHEGWSIGIEDAAGAVRQVVMSTGQAIATSSTQLRVWDTDDGPRHHIVDPRTGRMAPVVWSQVSCAAASCLEANAASTAAIVLGADAPAWLDRPRHPGAARDRRRPGRDHAGLARRDEPGRLMNELLWYLSRATGVVSIVLLTVVVVLGLVTSGRRRPTRRLRDRRHGAAPLALARA